MKKTFLFSIVILLTLNLMAQTSEQKSWKNIDSLLNIGQVKTAQEIINSKYLEYKKTNNSQGVIKTLIYDIKTRDIYQEDDIVISIDKIQEEIKISSTPQKQILHSILAELYNAYFSQNQWKIMNITPTDLDNNDIKTWDARKFQNAIISNIDLSLSDSEALKKLSLNDFEELIVKNEKFRKYRPTLYDLLAYNAMDFFAQPIQGVIAPANYFRIDKADYFSNIENFINFNIPTYDTTSFEYKGIKLYQDLLNFHSKDKQDFAAIIDADILRLQFVFNNTTLHAQKNNLYLEALRNLYAKYPYSEISTEVAYELANHLNNMGSEFERNKNTEFQYYKKEAVSIAETAIQRYPKSLGANNCKNLIEQIKYPNFNVKTDENIIPNKPFLAFLEYTNVNKLYYRIVKMSEKQYIKFRNTYDQDRFEVFLTEPFVVNGEIILPQTNDFQKHSIEYSFPKLEPGFYILIASESENFNPENLIIYHDFTSTSLSYVEKNIEKSIGFLVSNRETGEPMQDIKVEMYVYGQNDYRRDKPATLSKVFKTDEKGKLFIDKNKDRENYYLVFSNGKDKLFSDNLYSYYYDRDVKTSQKKVHLFTDRSIYRPGQTVYFKGICVNQIDFDTKILTNYNTNVTLHDVNGKQVSELKVSTNEFGSFNGSFTLPSSGLTGGYSIRTENGYISFNVEEYKRPTFEITFDKTESSYKLNQETYFKGKALTYSGTAVTDAKVTYRIERNVIYPFYRYRPYYTFFYQPNSVEITNGIVSTNADGSFVIPFMAIADEQISRKLNPVFIYTIYVDIVDINGETHSNSESISIGYKSLIVNTDIEQEVNKDKGISFKLKTENLQGVEQAAKGTIKISKLQTPDKVKFSKKWENPDTYIKSKSDFEKIHPLEIYKNENDYSEWKVEKIIFEKHFTTPSDSLITASKNPEQGVYLLKIETTDSFGEKIEYENYFHVYDLNNKKGDNYSPTFFKLLTNKVEPGQTATFVFGTPLKNAFVNLEVTNKDKIILEKQFKVDNEQLKFDIPVTEAERGNIKINLFLIKENRYLVHNETVQVPYSNKNLNITVGTFRSKVEPGSNQEWTINIKNNDNEAETAELLASMYDASLDAIIPHSWYFNIYNKYNMHSSWLGKSFDFSSSNSIISNYKYTEIINKDYERPIPLPFGYNYWYRGSVMLGGGKFKSRVALSDGIEEESAVLYATESLAAPPMPQESANSAAGDITDQEQLDSSTSQTTNETKVQKVDKPVKIRKDLNETAFFYPQLVTNEKGDIIIKFTVPESLTRWKMMGIAHSKDLKTGSITETIMTQKDLMVFPNVPRFFRDGDIIEFSTKVSNTSKENQNVDVILQLLDAYTMQPISKSFGLNDTLKNINISSEGNAVVNWKLNIPENLPLVVYRVIAKSNSFSDGEEGMIPIVTNRMLVTESFPLYTTGEESKTIDIERINSKNSSTLKTQNITLEYTSQPAWYAVQALPYIMESNFNSSDNIFSSYYASVLGYSIANSSPKIRQVFNTWKAITPETLNSNLEKNEELKAIILEETPWVRDAELEREQKHRIGLFFDNNFLINHQQKSIQKLQDLQLSNGAWSWFEGMYPNRYITQYIVTGFGRMYEMNIINSEQKSKVNSMLQRAVYYLDNEVLYDFNEIKKHDKNYLKSHHLNSYIIQYLYARALVKQNFPYKKEMNEVITYYNNQIKTYWMDYSNYLKGMMAIYTNSENDSKTSQLIMRALKETALYNSEMGMYWKNKANSWYWYDFDIETQAMMIEAFDKVLKDTESVDKIKVNLLKHKQTNNWKTTTSASNAVYALLMTGSNLLAEDKPVSVKINQIELNPLLNNTGKAEAGTGYFKTVFNENNLPKEPIKIDIKNDNKSISWGAMYWQYLEDLDKITSNDNPFKVQKQLFIKTNTPTGPVLKQITENNVLQVGDRVVVRMIIETDRNLEYVHIKDMRAAAFEPVNTVSGYKWNSSFGYYESIRDLANHFYVDNLRKGKYVFEYELFATQKGEFSNGITTVQCYYAPEFGSHSQGIRVKIF